MSMILPAVEVRDISKQYKLGRQGEQSGWWRAATRAMRGSDRSDEDENFIWALKNVSFSIAAGERVGIIGKNGAGKSTILKILSRVVYPTTGEARLRGRLTSLLEVGTGFNDQLTGRENVFLNAALHGLTKDEISARLSDIVSFAEIERFIDTPVKHYSSGMRMRLAFSVAAHLDPDILIMDEVLAVGDQVSARFCLCLTRWMPLYDIVIAASGSTEASCEWTDPQKRCRPPMLRLCLACRPVYQSRRNPLPTNLSLLRKRHRTRRLFTRSKRRMRLRRTWSAPRSSMKTGIPRISRR
jgi:ABC-type polysaccharide/polyol phosphate transport system ATPase subunit